MGLTVLTRSRGQDPGLQQIELAVEFQQARIGRHGARQPQRIHSLDGMNFLMGQVVDGQQGCRPGPGTPRPAYQWRR